MFNLQGVLLPLPDHMQFVRQQGGLHRPRQSGLQVPEDEPRAQEALQRYGVAGYSDEGCRASRDSVDLEG